MSLFGKIHQHLQPKRISRDLNDVQAIMNLLKETMINLLKTSLMSISSGTSPTDKIKDFLDKAYSSEKKKQWNISLILV